MQDRVSQTFAALADPTRRAMLDRLSEAGGGQASVSEIAAPFLKTMSLPAVTKHLKVLQKAGLVAQGRQAQWRPCRLQAAPLKEAADYVARYRKLWEGQFDRLDELLKEMQSTSKKRSKKP